MLANDIHRNRNKPKKKKKFFYWNNARFETPFSNIVAMLIPTRDTVTNTISNTMVFIRSAYTDEIYNYTENLRRNKIVCKSLRGRLRTFVNTPVNTLQLRQIIPSRGFIIFSPDPPVCYPSFSMSFSGIVRWEWGTQLVK